MFYYAVDCGNDTEVEGFSVTRSTDALIHGTITVYACADECFVERTCNNGTWSGDLPSCQCEISVPLCHIVSHGIQKLLLIKEFCCSESNNVPMYGIVRYLFFITVLKFGYSS